MFLLCFVSLVRSLLSNFLYIPVISSRNEQYEPKRVDITSFAELYTDVYKETLITFPEDTVEKNFGSCEAQTVMCCWVQDRFDDGTNDGNCEEDDCKDADPADNTDICYVDLKKSSGFNHVEGGYADYSGSEDEGTVTVMDLPGPTMKHLPITVTVATFFSSSPCMIT